MQVEIINNQDGVKLDVQYLKQVTSYILNKFDTDNNRSLNIIFESDKKIRELNKDYRHIDRVTDVLSFSYLEDNIEAGRQEGPGIIGEVYISPRVARKNSRSQETGWNLGLEIVLLIIHGVLHIFGYDHEQEEEKAAMYTIQDSLIHDIRDRDWNRY